MSDGIIEALDVISKALAKADEERKDAEARREKLRKAFFELATVFVGPDNRYDYDCQATGRRLQRVVVVGSPSIDYTSMEGTLDPEVFDRVVKKTKVVSYTYEIDYDAFLESVNREEITRFQIDKFTEPGRISCRLVHNKIKTAEPEEAPLSDPLRELLAHLPEPQADQPVESVEPPLVEW